MAIKSREPKKAAVNGSKHPGKVRHEVKTVFSVFGVIVVAVVASLWTLTYRRPSGHSPPPSESGEAANEFPTGFFSNEVEMGPGRHKAFLLPERHQDKDIRKLPTGGLDKVPYGDFGLGVKLDEALMSPEEREKRSRMYHAHYFEEYISELISVNRSLPDFRNPWCKETYGDVSPASLRTATIVICFHNEAWSTLIRSLHSIVNRTPKELIQEIILVDDNSKMEHLGQRLDNYLKEHFEQTKIRLIRLKERHGLMRARMMAVQASVEDTILMFLDSHIEATTGWLEPLLLEVTQDPKVVATPQIDEVSPGEFYYHYVSHDVVGGFDWNFRFYWYTMADEHKRKQAHFKAPYEYPVLSGGLFAIDKAWFKRLGYFDEGMEIWGGENFELSFKQWMCGGKLKMVPCSHVGHVFRHTSPYRADPVDAQKNYMRAAEVWMDEYKHLFFHRLGSNPPQMDQSGLAERKQLRENLKCHDFSWYLDNIATLYTKAQRFVAAGRLRNPSKDLCMDKPDTADFYHVPVDALPCIRNGEISHQYWLLSTTSFLLRDLNCIAPNREGVAVVHPCPNTGVWFFDQDAKRMKHRHTGKCLTLFLSNQGLYHFKLEGCKDGDPDQEFEWDVYDNSHVDGIPYERLTADTYKV